MALTDEIKEKAARVARKATRVRIDEDAIEAYARALPAESPPAPDLAGADDETRAAFSLQLNAINFGSGWFPTLNKPPGLSGFRTIEAGLRRHGPWTANELKVVTRKELAATFGQDPDHPLMALFERHLRDLGKRVGPSFATFARSGNATDVAAELATWPTWYDISPYHGAAIPFFKRAQIAAADLALSGLTDPKGLDELTLFADNLVPHVLRIDGVLRFDEQLVARIDDGELIEHDSPEEVEIRAVALHAVELLVQAHGATTATAVDNVLWLRGAGSEYKAHPRHRARTTAY
ncbi:queuosine salvage family protein [Solirubrobacter phytolaccae]|uniref:Queuosine 5'-phosphate N-glycosylase/hydrolase n=1 Tax=Solirubrobacter phytolaccae TaxID=1404360 RepID=A0A9X3N9L4_9ACTN|nr:queuosine salvage family protein [Solirubrobacter phytolaccae]MDA0180930.1 queuosine salvage family protein [Solirubrobacter phytolaccae]